MFEVQRSTKEGEVRVTTALNPPLRDRPGDVRAFAEYFAEKAATGLAYVPYRSAMTMSARWRRMRGRAMCVKWRR